MNKSSQVLLITGGAGFIGSNFVVYMTNKYPDYHIINVDKLTYAGTQENLVEIEYYPNYTFIKGDIADPELVSHIFSEYDVTGVIHLAAESHVDRSITDGTSFVETNLLGTFTLLQAAKRKWEAAGKLDAYRFHYVSTDEIYGSLDDDGKFSEDRPLDPRNPYSATKAGGNLLVKSFGYTYGMNIVMSSCSNNYGPKQHDEKLIPTIIKNALQNQPIPIYGDGQNIRDWIYVGDHCQALDVIFHKGERMNLYNVGGRTEKTNIEMAETVCDILEKIGKDKRHHNQNVNFKDLITYTEDRLGHDRRYAVDDSKIREELGWKPVVDFREGLKKTVEWYINQWTHIKH